MKMMGFGKDISTVLVGVMAGLVMPVLVAFYYFIYAALKADHDGVMNISVHA